MIPETTFLSRVSAAFADSFSAGWAFFVALIPAFLRPSERAYQAAKLGGPHQLWSGSSGSAEAAVRAGRSRVTARVRDLDQNNPFVAGMADKRSVRILGDEIALTPQVPGLSREGNKELERRFLRWAETAMLDGSSLTEGLQIGLNHDLFDGEFLFKRVISAAAGGNPLRLQGFECDHLDTSKGTQGIEYDASGTKAEAFWIQTINPTDPDFVSSGSVRVPADQVYHFRSVRRFSQRRGISPLAPAVMRLYGVDDLEDAELMAARSGAAYGIILKSPLAGSLPTGGYVGPDGSDGTPRKDGNNRTLRYIESGGILELAPGEEASAFNSNRPNSNFEPFVRNRKRDTTGSAGLSYEEATGDYSQVNYSSARMAQNIAWALTKRQQAKVCRLLNWIYRQWLALEVLLIGVPSISKIAFSASPLAFEEVAWQLAGSQGPDPKKDAETLELEIALGVQSRTNYCSERGRNHAEIVKQLEAEKAGLKEASLYQEDPVVPNVVSTSVATSTSFTGEPGKVPDNPSEPELETEEEEEGDE
jgi:lambda family phage portal protein